MLSRRALLRSALCSCAFCSIGSLAPLVADAAEAPSKVDGLGYELWFLGRQHELMMNPDVPLALDLRTLAGRRHLYGLGPLAGMRGEVTIADGRPALARVAAERAIAVEATFEAGVPFFVWAEVPSWQRQRVPPEVRSFEDLERLVPKAAAAAGLDPDRPLPFLLLGSETAIEFHILNRAAGAGDGMQEHRKLQETFEVEQVEATLVGFHSFQHRGVFTPRDSNIHVHFQTSDNTRSGHVQKLQLGSDAILAFPTRA